MSAQRRLSATRSGSGSGSRRAWTSFATCKFTRFTDNFITIGANPGNIDWFDDEGWQRIVEHWRIAAWLAKQSGLKGLLFDPEPYTPPHSQFNYAAQPGRKQHGFNEYAAKARQRGRQVMRAVAEEYPEITIFCYFMNSVSATAAGRADPRPALAAQGYGLYPAMIDGWLDAAPPTVVLVDGCESAYLYNSRQQFLESAIADQGGLPGVGLAREPGQVPCPSPGEFRHVPRCLLEPQGVAMVHRRSGRSACRASARQYFGGAGCGRRVRLGLRRAVPLVAHAEPGRPPGNMVRGDSRLRAGVALCPRPAGLRPNGDRQDESRPESW